MNKLPSILFAAALALLGNSLAQAVPPPTGNGFYGSVTWDTGWGQPLVTFSVGPYVTYGDCYDAWMVLANSNPQWSIHSMQTCSLHATHQPMLEVAFQVDFGGAGNPIGSVDEAVRLNAEVERVRRQFNADAYEAALQRIR